MLDFIFYHTPIFYLIQSVWRDEAFSYFMAKPNIGEVIANTLSDFNPPLYYLLLHFFINIFGKGDELLRLLSFFPHLFTSYFAYLLGKKLFGRKFAFFLAAFTFFNPMLLYYAFEMRMYSLYAFFTIASLYFFLSKNWRWFTITSAAGLYTHSFFLLILVSYFAFLFFTHQLNKKNIFQVIKPVLFFIPWLPVLIIAFFRAGRAWMFPVDSQLITSVIGNLFTGYEGTPGNWWRATAFLSVTILLFFLIAFKRKRKLALLFLTPIFLPLSLILGYSILKSPIYVNRYLIFITVFEIMGIALGIWSIHGRVARFVSLFFWLIFVISLNIVTVPYHKKTDFKTTFSEINKMANKNDLVFAETPIGFLESAYYYKYQDRVFIYNPNNIPIPNYIGVTVVFPKASKSSLPPPPARVFLVNDEASFSVIINQ